MSALRFQFAPSGLRLAGLVALVAACGGVAPVGAADVTGEASVSQTAPVAVEAPRVREAKGRVLVRAAGGAGYRGRAAPGLALAAGEVVVTGPGARVELEFADKGRWRVGQEAIWRLANERGDAVLSAGSALLAVPAGREVRVEGVGATLRLSEGAWLLTAVLNDGFKVVALDRGVVRLESAAGEAVDSAGGATASKMDERRLAAGEVVFVSPGGKGFGPTITVFLDELLATSRLVRGFSAELPQAERLRQQGAAQRESLAKVGNVFVGGAREADRFQLIVPKDSVPAAPKK